MPPYAFLAEHDLDYRDIADHLKANRLLGVPYSDDMITNAKVDLEAQINPDGDSSQLVARYPKAVVASFAGNPKRVTEMDALVSYLQMLGTTVDFSHVTPQQLTQ
jgi:cytochrome c oxidase cbb3-type subunit 2